MGGFLYFIPEHITNVQQLDDWGLGYVFGKDVPGFAPCQGRGVGGVQGTTVGDERHMPRSAITYKPEQQIWRKLPATKPQSDGATKGQVWVGFAKDSPPGPMELLRRDALDGHMVRLGDGNEWMIPVARGAAEESGELRYFARLPRQMDLSESGAWISGGIVPRYAELWTVACQFWNAFIAGRAEGAAVQMEFGDVIGAAMTALSTNYRVRAVEAALLGLFDEDNCWSVCRALIDWPTIESFLQKKTMEGS